MQLLERYLDAIKKLLPARTQDDIIRELSEDLRCQMEDKEAELGRPLTESEQEAIIKAYGHPVVVAARYGRAHYLIGPALFPFYWLILKIAMVGALVVRTIIAAIVVAISADPGRALMPALLGVPEVLIPVFFWVTAAFAIFEFSSAHSKSLSAFGIWNPRTLPKIGSKTGTLPRTQSAAEVIFGLVAAMWWQAAPNAPFLILGPASRYLAVSPIWTALHWPILLLTLAAVGFGLINFFEPRLTTARVRARLLVDGFGIAILWDLTRAGSWLAVSPGVAMPNMGQTISIVNQSFRYCFVIGLIFATASLTWKVVGQLRHTSSLLPLTQVRS